MFLSIIVPAYNVEKYLKKCILSLENQDIDDYEIIIVNDCSTDNTLNVIHELNYKNIVVIEKKENTGLSDTRNIGLDKAQGKYIMFVDSDDYLEKNILSRIKNYAENNNPDLVYLRYSINRNGVISKIKHYYSNSDKIYSSFEFLKNELNQRSLPIAACFAVYRRQFLIDNNLKFKVGYLHEDELWTPLCLLKAKKIGTIDLYFYNYIIRDNSITQKKDKTKNGLDLLKISCILDEESNNIEDSELKVLFKNHIAMIYMKAVSRGNLSRKKYRENINRFFPLKRAYFKKDKLKAILFMISPKLYTYIDQKVGNNI